MNDQQAQAKPSQNSSPSLQYRFLLPISYFILGASAAIALGASSQQVELPALVFLILIAVVCGALTIGDGIGSWRRVGSRGRKLSTPRTR